MITYRFRPIQTWPRPFTKPRRGSQFDSTYKATLELLSKELASLTAHNVIIQLALSEYDIRNDGLPRANSRPAKHPGVMLSFDSRHGPLTYCCDEFPGWEDNLRGIALTLQRLRMADLYGVTKSGEQYSGFAALPAPSDGVIKNADDAASFIAQHTNGEQSMILADATAFTSAYRTAARKLHPDAGGDHEAFVTLQKAAEYLKRHHGL